MQASPSPKESTLIPHPPFHQGRMICQLYRVFLRMGFVGLVVVLALVGCGEKEPDGQINSSNETESRVTASATTSSQPEIRVNVAVASVFTLPNRGSEIFYSLVEGDRVAVSGKSRPDELGTIFYLVRIGDRIGWVAASQVEFNGNPDALTVVDMPSATLVVPDETAGTPIATETVEVIVNRVILRIVVAETDFLDKPSDDANPIFRAVQDDEFQASYKTPVGEDGNSFYGVRLPNATGWIRSDLVEVSGDTAALVVVISPTPLFVPSTVATTPPAATAIVNQPTPTITLFPAVGSPDGSSSSTPESSTATATPVLSQPSATATLAVTRTPRPTATPTERIIRQVDAPSLNISLPEGWQEGHILVPVVSALSAGTTDVRLSIYEGPLPGGLTGHIWIVWGFPGIMPPFSQEVDLWPDAILYLRQLLFNTCNINANPEGRTTYLLDELEAIGSTFQAVDCGGGLSDMAGRFMAVSVEDINYSFYFGVEPANAVSEGLLYMQALINSVDFLPRNDR